MWCKCPCTPVDIGCPETGVKGDCELPDVGAETEFGSPERTGSALCHQVISLVYTSAFCFVLR